MIQTHSVLDDLTAHIRQSLPDSKSIVNLKVQQNLGVITFFWHGVEFLVKPPMQVLELRGNNVYITGLSTLLQLVLARKNQQEKLLENALTRISEVEEIIQSQDGNGDSAVRILGSVRETLQRMLK